MVRKGGTAASQMRCYFLLFYSDFQFILPFLGISYLSRYNNTYFFSVNESQIYNFRRIQFRFHCFATKLIINVSDCVTVAVIHIMSLFFDFECALLSSNMISFRRQP